MSALYVRIASEIREQIKTGVLPIHAQLSERRLAERYDTGRSTIAAALKILKEEGYLESAAKSGTRVRLRPPEASACWEKMTRTGMSASSTTEALNTIKYLIFSGKLGITFGMGSEFAPYEPLRRAFASLLDKGSLDKDLNTFDARGLPVLRETLSEHMKSYGIDAHPDHIVVFQGHLEAVYTIAAALLNQGANLYYMQGDMIQYMATMRSTGVNMHEIPVDGSGPLPAKFEQMIRHKQPNMLYINPVNSFSSGLNFSAECMDGLAQVCDKYNVAVLENNFLGDVWIKPPPAPLKARTSERVIYVGTMANSYVTGLRVGWAVLPGYIVPRVCDVKMQMNSANNSGVELIANEILSKGYYGDFLKGLREILPARAEKINTILATYLDGLAKWNPENIVYNVSLEFEDKIDVDRIVIENPYFMIPTKSANGRRNRIFTNVLGMTVDDFEILARKCGESIKTQMGKQ